jgi:hypothetical protein
MSTQDLAGPQSQSNHSTASQLISWLKSSPSSNQQLLLQAIRNERCKRDALYWAQTWTLTENPKYLEQNLPFRAPFPQKSYFRPLFNALRTQKRIFIPKTREMITSWSVMVHATHAAQWYKAEVIVQTDSEEKAKQLVGYAECLYRNQPEWLKSMHSLEREASALGIGWKDGGKVFGIPKGENKIRMFHPTMYIMDEAAFLPEAEACYNAAHPVAGQIIAISSAGPGWFGDECSL